MSDEVFFRQFHAELAAAWAAANRPRQEEALRLGTEFVDQMFRFRGARLFGGQALSWPRSGVVDGDGRVVTGVPRAVQDAACFIGGCHLAGRGLLQGDHERDAKIIAHVLALLEGLLDPDEPLADWRPHQRVAREDAEPARNGPGRAR